MPILPLSPCLMRASRRYLTRSRWNLWLSLLGIGLGVAVVIAVDLANASAHHSFNWSMDAVAGKATHQILGGPAGIPEQTYVDLRLRGDPWPSAPVVEGNLTIRGQPYSLLGVDPLAERPFRDTAPDTSSGDARRLFTEPNGLLLPAAVALELGLKTGDSLALDVGGHARQGRLVGQFESANPVAREGLVVTDIATAQELLNRVGVLDRIDLILTPEQVDPLTARLPAGLRLERTQARTQATARLTEAFQINLSAMSLLALVVGGFIIYNTMTFSVLQRRGLFGSLRVLGVTRRELFGLILAESLAVGMVGGLLGLAAGILIAQGLVRLVTHTVNDLYFTLTVTRLFLSPQALAKGLVLGLGASLAAALGPAWEAAASEPRDVQRRTLIETRLGRLLPWLTWSGLGLLAAGLGLAQLPGQGLAAAFFAIFLVVVGFSLMVPRLLGWACAALMPLADRLAPPVGRMAVRGLSRSLSRTGPAVAALTVAVAATLGVGIMIESFRATVALWLGQTLSSDIYVSAPSGVSNRATGTLDPRVLPALEGLPGIRDISRARNVRLDTERGETLVLALRPGAQSFGGFRFQGAVAEDLWPRFLAGDWVLASEPYAHRHGVKAGDEVRLFSNQGWRSFRIGAVFRDYSTDQGLLVLHQPVYAALWGDPGLSNLGILLTNPASGPETLRTIRDALAPLGQSLRIRATGELRDYSLAVFDRTFAITRVLRLLSVGVAFIGIFSALLALYLERAKEHAIFRAIGATPNQMLGLVTLQSLVLGLTAGLLALPLGTLMAELLIHVVNLRSFGWTIDTLWPWSGPLEALALALSAALLAGLYPAWRIAHAEPADALREE